MPLFRKKPVVIDAFKWTGDNIPALTTWAAHADLDARRRKGDTKPCVELPLELVSRGDGTFDLEIHTLESGHGTHKATIGDMIICGVRGEFYPCKPDIFDATYEAVER